ncbi:MAG: IS3 family transposase [Ktedonobacteraceae bacterium]
MIEWVAQAVKAGAREDAACELLGMNIRTLQRWRSVGLVDARKGAAKTTARKMSDSETQLIYKTVNEERFADMTPEQVISILAQESTYLASASTVYRVLRARNAVIRRTDSKTPTCHPKPAERVATGPNQVWSWDITWMSTDVKGLYFYAYVIMDLFDRSIVGWAIHDREDGQLARDLFERSCRDQKATPNFLHSDNGGPMKAYTLVEFLYARGICLTTNRPRVSNDNPFSESLFKTLKYRAGYPKSFKTLLVATSWFADFVDWYNTKHLHSCLAYVTPQQRRHGLAHHILDARNQTIALARSKHPLRWGTRPAKRYQLPEEVVLNPAKAS